VMNKPTGWIGMTCLFGTVFSPVTSISFQNYSAALATGQEYTLIKCVAPPQTVPQRVKLSVWLGDVQMTQNSVFFDYQCSPGYGAINTSSPCLPCAPGYFQNNFTQNTTKCGICPINTYSTEGSANCTSCPPGTYSIPGSGFCKNCQKGQTSINGSCIPCPPGSYAEFPGSIQCYPCPSGTRAPLSGSGHCELCPAGTYQTSVVGVCAPCPIGFYSTVPGSSVCQSCPDGNSTLKNGQSSPDSCYRCPIGTARSFGRLGGCKSCVEGFYAAHLSSPRCDACPRGFFSASKAHNCTPCAKGYDNAHPGSPICIKGFIMRPQQAFLDRPIGKNPKYSSHASRVTGGRRRAGIALLVFGCVIITLTLIAAIVFGYIQYQKYVVLQSIESEIEKLKDLQNNNARL